MGRTQNTGSPVVSYITEEVWRQGHDVTVLDGIQRVEWMLYAWLHALNTTPRAPTMLDIEALGRWIEPHKNRGLRAVEVRVGNRACPPAAKIKGLLEGLLPCWSELAPLDFYREFELIHPFVDGNGRVGKVLLNWHNDTLLAPIFPPEDFWGLPILNP